MKSFVKLCRILILVLATCVISNLCLSVVAEVGVSSDFAKIETGINASKIGELDTLLLPSAIVERNNTFFPDSSAEFRVESALRERFFESRISSIHIFSENPEIQGREWVDSSVDKSNKAKGFMVMLASDGSVVHSGRLTQIKGRGNTTWGLIKKPYQIKLEDKVDLIGSGDESNKSKTWILLANYLDSVGIRNTLALNLGQALGMPMNIQGVSVDLYYDGEYRGVYMLTEKVEVGSGRVDIADLEKENQTANPNVLFENLPIAKGSTENGATYTYCEGMVSPADISGGYLLEMDYQERALEEICYICTSRGNYVVVKSPEYASKEEMNYIATLYQDYEDSVYEGGVNHRTNKKYSDYIDTRSLACYYLINEFSKSRDCFSSSAYLSKKPGEEKFVMGPLWDYDMSFGKGSLVDYYADDDPFGFIVKNVEFGKKLLNIQDFSDIMTQIYKNEFEPLINNVVLGDKDAVSVDGSLRSLEYYKDLLSNSAQYNSELWYNNQTWMEDVDKLYYFVSQRRDVLNTYFEDVAYYADLPDNVYYDVWSTDWFYDTVTMASEKDILNGDGNGFFRPYDQVRRSHAAQVMFNMAGRKYVTSPIWYKDVNVGDWFADAVAWTAVNGYMEGYPDETFRPNDMISREEFVDCLYRFVGSPAVVPELIYGFEDQHLVTKMNAVEWALKEGIIRGTGNGINPQSAITRAEMSTIIVRYLNKV